MNFYFRLVFAHHSYEVQVQVLIHSSIIHDFTSNTALHYGPNNNIVKLTEGESKKKHVRKHSLLGELEALVGYTT